MASRKQDFRTNRGQHKAKAASSSMTNSLASAESMKHFDFFGRPCGGGAGRGGIHGAARARKGLKDATVHMARRLGKKAVQDGLQDD